MALHIEFKDREEQDTFQSNLKVMCLSYIQQITEEIKFLNSRIARLLSLEESTSEGGIASNPSVSLRNAMLDLRKLTVDYEKLAFLYHHTMEATFNVTIGKPFTRSVYESEPKIISAVLKETAQATGLI